MAILTHPIFLQARMGSTRYPGKMIEDIAGKTLLERVLIRLEFAAGSPQVLVIPEDEANRALQEIARRREWKVFRGSEDDVLKRYADALSAFPCRYFLRATGDNPFVEPRALHAVSDALSRATVARSTGFPQGTNSEGASMEALEIASREAVDSAHREHVMPFLYAHPERFSIEVVEAPPEIRRAIRLTVDTAEDIERTRILFKKFGDYPKLEDVLEYMNVAQAPSPVS